MSGVGRRAAGRGGAGPPDLHCNARANTPRRGQPSRMLAALVRARARPAGPEGRPAGPDRRQSRPGCCVQWVLDALGPSSLGVMRSAAIQGHPGPSGVACQHGASSGRVRAAPRGLRPAKHIRYSPAYPNVFTKFSNQLDNFFSFKEYGTGIFVWNKKNASGYLRADYLEILCSFCCGNTVPVPPAAQQARRPLDSIVHDRSLIR